MSNKARLTFFVAGLLAATVGFAPYAPSAAQERPAISTLGAIAIGSSEYYAYAYISAPEPYCEGLTEDGCQLMWQEVETIEGGVVNQCVAYCPWQ